MRGYFQFTTALTEAFKDLKVIEIHKPDANGELCPRPQLDFIVVAPMESQEKEVTGNGVIYTCASSVSVIAVIINPRRACMRVTVVVLCVCVCVCVRYIYSAFSRF